MKAILFFIFHFSFFILSAQSYIITNVAGQRKAGYSGDGGPAVLAELNGPMSIYADDSGNVFVADIGNERIRKINSGGLISTFAGNGAYGFEGDGGPATNAEFED